MLVFPIKKKWFDMILSGEKKEEYRELKPYYKSRIRKEFSCYPYSGIPCGEDYQNVEFRNGYGSSVPAFIALCKVDIKTGKPEWGAEPGVEYYVFSIDKIVWKSSDNMGGYVRTISIFGRRSNRWIITP